MFKILSFSSSTILSSFCQLADFAYECYLEGPVKAELTIVWRGYLIPKKDTWENRPAKSSAEYFSSIEIQLP